MTVALTRRADITLDAVHRVAWRGEAVRITEAALRRMADCRAAFLRLIDTDPDLVIYGVTTAMGELADRRLRLEERDRHARIKAFAAATAFGDPLPDRVVRGIVLARLANFLEGHAATTPRIALAVAAMLDGGPLPAVPASGQGGAGEILALYPLFAALTARLDLEVKERGSLINGSPCAAALLADSALAARNRIRLAETVFALSIEAFRAPLEHYDAALEPLWNDPHEAAALRRLRALLDGAGDGRRGYQAPVSYRIVPRVLGQAHRALAATERAAAVSLAAVSDNPVYIPPDEAGLDHPNGRCLSTGGYHNAMAAPALDDLAAIWADLCLLCDRHSSKLLAGRVSHLPDLLMVGRDPADSDGHGSLGYVPMAVTGYLEQAKAAAQRTFLPGTEAAGAGQDDVAAPAFLAWAKEERAGRCLDAALAMLAVIASQALQVTGRAAPPPLRPLIDEVRSLVPPVEEDRVLGPELGRLAERFTQRVFAAE
ncbi:aromatic amino acid lyase [Inquilinus limosus]|uniref:aromatic amino acid lyase n=1 Tax=Inquilinus limosus TaxID=171674 RepID=UPI00040A0EC2|nr:aromatic amino acid lyase [Inquilinus limosus]